MKEAAGEANMTVITIVLIGIVAAIAIPLVRNMMNNSAKQSCCMSAGGYWQGGDCKGLTDAAEYTACQTAAGIK